jgi:hypothetical protein
MYSGLVCSENLEPSPKHLTVFHPTLLVAGSPAQGGGGLNPMIRKLATMLSLNLAVVCTNRISIVSCKYP